MKQSHTSAGLNAPDSHPLDLRHRRLLTLGTFAALAAFAVGVNITGPALDSIARDYNLGLPRAGLFFSMVMIGFGAGVLMGGFLTDRLSAKGVAFLGLGALTLGLIAFGGSPLFGSALAAMALIGLGGGLIMGFINPLISSLHPDKVGMLLNHLHAVYPAAALIVGATTGALLQMKTPWRGIYFAAACLAVCASLPFVNRPCPPARG